MLSGLSRIFRKPFANVHISRKVAFAHVWQIYACGPRSCKTFHGFLHDVHIYTVPQPFNLGSIWSQYLLCKQRYAHILKHLNASRRLSPCPTPQTLDATMWLYLPPWQCDSRPQQPVKLLQKTRADTSKIWSILIGSKNCPSQPNSLGAPVGGSLFLQQLFIHKTSQRRLSEDGQSLTPFNIIDMRRIAVFQPQPSQLVQDCVNQPSQSPQV